MRGRATAPSPLGPAPLPVTRQIPRDVGQARHSQEEGARDPSFSHWLSRENRGALGSHLSKGGRNRRSAGLQC